MTDAVSIYVGIALVAGHVLGESLRDWSSGRRSRVAGVALVVIVASYALLGAWTLWPVPVFAGLLFAVVRSADARRPETAYSWVALQIGVFLNIALFTNLLLPKVIATGAVSLSLPVWGVGFFATVTLITGLGAALSLGSAFMNVAIRPFAVQMRGPEAIEMGGKVIEPLEDGFKNAGRVIGHYERLLILLFVLADAPVAIGFLVAAKSVFRFGDLTDSTNRKNAEYLIIGTLMSFAYALAVSYGTRFVLRLLLDNG